MRILLQRVRKASVSIDGGSVASINEGLLGLAGFGVADDALLPMQPRWKIVLDKVPDLRIFPDEAGKMNVSLRDFGRRVENAGAGELLLVSQFTLYADCRKGRRPSFDAAPPEVARLLFDRLVEDMRERLPGRVHAGVFAADMEVELVNWGPVTILLDDSVI